MKLLARQVVLVAATAVIVWTVVAPLRAGQQAPPPEDAVLSEARQAYDATNYERARDLLDLIISGLGTAPRPEQRQLMVAAHELRARTRVNLRDLDGARSDFRALLLVDPSYLLSATVAPRVLTLFEEIKRSTVGTVAISVVPADAQVVLDDVRLPAGDVPSLNLVGGAHTLSASRTGYATSTQSFTVVPGVAPATITMALERVASTLVLTTSPANIEVVIDGVSRGTTELDPSAKAESGGLLSKRFTIADLPNGRHRLEFRRECFIGTEQELDVPKPSDYTLDGIKLSPAVATVRVDANVPGGSVFVDDAPRGTAPLVMEDICQGSHVIEVRTPYGRHLKRMDLKTGEKEVFQAQIRPAFAIVSDSGAGSGVRGGPDLRLAAEAAFQETSTITLFAPSEKRAAELLAADQLPVDWLAFDVVGRPLGKASTIGEPARAEIGAKQARTLYAQGLAAIARDPSGDQSDMLLTLLAPGSVQPDVLKWRLNDPRSIREAVRQLDEGPPLLRLKIGVLALDVQDVQGVVVGAVEEGGSAEAAGIHPGDVILSAGGTPVTTAVQLLTSVNAQQKGQPMALELKDAADAPKKLAVAVQAVPNVVSLNDQGLRSNKLALEYAFRASALTDPLDEVAVRLNMAALALRLHNRADATRELDRVIKSVADGRVPAALNDAVTGTAQYLLGLAAEAGGDMAAAERAWKVAAQSHSTFLVDNGEPLKELAQSRLGLLTPAPPLGR